MLSVWQRCPSSTAPGGVARRGDARRARPHCRDRAAAECVHHRHGRRRPGGGTAGGGRDRHRSLARPNAQHPGLGEGPVRRRRRSDHRRVALPRRRRASSEDSAVVQRLREAGRSSSARTTCTSSPTGPPARPRTSDRCATPGTRAAFPAAPAAAVAQRSPQAWASRRSAPIPAARSEPIGLCGVVGLKPTFER